MHYTAEWSFVSNKLPCNGTLICILHSMILTQTQTNINSISYQEANFSSGNTISFKSSSDRDAATEFSGTASFYKSSCAIPEMALAEQREKVRVGVVSGCFWGCKGSCFGSKGGFTLNNTLGVEANRWRYVQRCEKF